MTRDIAPTLAALLLALVSAAPAAAAQPPELGVVVRPSAQASDGRIDHLDITVTLSGLDAAAGAPLLRMPLVTSNVVTTATQLGDIDAADAQGPLHLAAHDDPEGGPKPYRHWTADRPVAGLVTVQYRVPITNALPARGAAPPLDIRSDEGGFGGAAGDFLMLPDTDQPVQAKLSWDFGALPKGAVGLSNWGPGDVAPSKPVASRELESLYVMGGLIGRYPDPPPAEGFISGWEGTPPFDARALMTWTKTLHDRYDVFFNVPASRPYAVFLRRNFVNAGGGVELGGAFVGSYGTEKDVSEFKITLAHEMLHTFVGGLDTDNELAGSWFTEGMAVFYARRLALRFDHIDPDAFLKDLNGTAARYYTDALADTPNDQIPARFWAETRVRTLPYDRGSMYFAVVDSEMRAASGGKRSLDDLLEAMLARRQAGRAMDQAAWVETVTEALGPKGRMEFEAMLAGAEQLPPSDGFGPCFRRTTRPLRRYELGFESKVLVEPARVVRGLVPGSAAEAAGLRNGDVIVQPVPQDRIQGDQTATLTLKIRRDGRESEITYLPRGETVQAWQWERVPGVPDKACAL